MPADSPAAVGVIANPASGRDLRRLLAWASVYPTSEKVHGVLRLLCAMGSTGVREAWMMPDTAGLAAHVRESAELARERRGLSMPRIRMLDMPVRDSATDSMEAAARMRAAGLALIAVFGGDGTHRAVATTCGEVPLAAVSTGTNNAFPEWREATSIGLAAGLVALGRVPAHVGLRANKRLRLSGQGREEIALVDVCVTRQSSIGARAVWRGGDLSELYVAFAEPTAIGLSSIAGLTLPVSRDEAAGVHIRIGAGRTVQAAVMPGLVEPVNVSTVERWPMGDTMRLPALRGTVALDGEREIEIDERSEWRLDLDWSGPRTVAVEAALDWAARHGLMVSPPEPLPPL